MSSSGSASTGPETLTARRTPSAAVTDWCVSGTNAHPRRMPRFFISSDDVEGANAVGMRGILLDRENRYPEVEEKLTDLRELPAALGLAA